MRSYSKQDRYEGTSAWWFRNVIFSSCQHWKVNKQTDAIFSYTTAVTAVCGAKLSPFFKWFLSAV